MKVSAPETLTDEGLLEKFSEPWDDKMAVLLATRF